MKIKNNVSGNTNLHHNGKLILHDSIVRTTRDRNWTDLINKRSV